MRLALLALAFAVVPQSGDPTPAPTVSNDNLLASKSSFEALADVATLSLENGRTLNLEPGIRVTRADGAYSLATHDGKRLQIQAGTEKLSLASPVLARLSDRGWEFNGAKPVPASSILARRQAQDDTDSNLKSMQESARKLKNNSKDKSTQKVRVRWIYGEDPMAGAEVYRSAAIQQLAHISAIGF
jgi:hypothetical protein